MNSIMLDLETLGVRPGSAILSVGAVAFDLGSAEPCPTFYRNVQRMSCWSAGLTVDQSTIDWWRTQTEAARAALETDAKPLREVAEDFHAWFRALHVRYIWSQGGNFDEPLWSAVARGVGLTVPWKFYDCRCTRTIYHVAGLDPRTIKREGDAHNALHDAVYQVACVQRAYAMIQEKKT